MRTKSRSIISSNQSNGFISQFSGDIGVLDLAGEAHLWQYVRPVSASYSRNAYSPVCELTMYSKVPTPCYRNARAMFRGNKAKLNKTTRLRGTVEGAVCTYSLFVRFKLTS